MKKKFILKISQYQRNKGRKWKDIKVHSEKVKDKNKTRDEEISTNDSTLNFLFLRSCSPLYVTSWDNDTWCCSTSSLNSLPFSVLVLSLHLFIVFNFFFSFSSIFNPSKLSQIQKISLADNSNIYFKNSKNFQEWKIVIKIFDLKYFLRMNLQS